MKTLSLCVMAIFFALCFATLPGCRKSSSDSMADHVGGADKGVIPILLGKNFEEVTAIMGRIPDQTNPGGGTTKLGWTYENIPVDQFAWLLEFDDNSPDPRVCDGIWRIYSSTDGSIPVIKPTQIVPKDVWEQDPVDIYRSIDVEAIVIHWRIDNNEYIAVLQDNRRKLFDVIKGLDDQGILRIHCELTEAGRDFRSCDQIVTFIYIKGKYDFFKPMMAYQDPTLGSYGIIRFQKF